MTIGLEVRKISERYNNISTSEFGKSSYTETFDDEGWFQSWSSKLVALSLDDNCVKLTNGDGSYKTAMMKGSFIKAAFSGNSYEETMLRFLVIGKGSSTLGFGIATGVGEDEADHWGAKACVGMYSQRNRITISDTDDPLWEVLMQTTGSGVTQLYNSPLLGTYDYSIHNVYELRVYFIKSVGQGTVKLRTELLINNQIMDQTEMYSDVTNNHFAKFADECRPVLIVFNSNNVHMQYVGLFRN